MFYKNKKGSEIRVIVKDAEIKDGGFRPTRVIPAGKREIANLSIKKFTKSLRLTFYYSLIILAS